MIFGGTFNFRDFFGNLINHYIKANDSYKDSNNQGLFERYLRTFGETIDEEHAEKIENYLNIIDAQICDPQFINHISDTLGNPPDVFNNEQQYRNLLSYILSVYKIKGTVRGYQLFFNILGFNVTIYEVPLNDNNSNYDQEDSEYDNGVSLYDQNQCQPCSFYDITFSPINPETVLTESIVNSLRLAISFNEPINAKLRNLIYSVNFEDSMEISVTEDEPEFVSELVNKYDSDRTYDEDNTPVPQNWYLGSKDEMALFQEQLVNSIPGPYPTSSTIPYWTSSETGVGNNVWLSKTPGAPPALPDTGLKDNAGANRYILPIRKFEAADDAYNIGDNGPMTGLVPSTETDTFIFHRVSLGGGLATYYEAAWIIQNTSPWSNITTSPVFTNNSDGENNTELIISQSGHTNSAALTCREFNL